MSLILPTSRWVRCIGIWHSHTEHSRLKITTKFRKEVNCFSSNIKSSSQNTQILRFVLRSNLIKTVEDIFQRQLWPVWNICLTKLYFSFAPLGGSVDFFLIALRAIRFGESSYFSFWVSVDFAGLLFLRWWTVPVKKKFKSSIIQSVHLRVWCCAFVSFQLRQWHVKPVLHMKAMASHSTNRKKTGISWA